MDSSKEPALLGLATVMNAAQVPWVIIGGVAAQVRLAESRTTLDIDVAVHDSATRITLDHR